MATLAALWNGTTVEADSPEEMVDNNYMQAEPYRSRALPFESVYVYRKPINNGRLERIPDTRERRATNKAMVGALVAAVFIMLLALPRYWDITASRELQSLQQEYTRLAGERDRLRAEEARLLDPKNQDALANTLYFEDADPSRVRTPEGSLAYNSVSDVK